MTIAYDGDGYCKHCTKGWWQHHASWCDLADGENPYAGDVFVERDRIIADREREIARLREEIADLIELLDKAQLYGCRVASEVVEGRGAWERARRVVNDYRGLA